MRVLTAQVSGNVEVTVDAPSSQFDLAKVMSEMREQYEAIMIKNKKEQENWFNTQVRNWQGAKKVDQKKQTCVQCSHHPFCPKDADPSVTNHHKHHRGADVHIGAVWAEEVLPVAGDLPAGLPKGGTVMTKALPPSMGLGRLHWKLLWPPLCRFSACSATWMRWAVDTASSSANFRWPLPRWRQNCSSSGSP